MSVTGIFQQSSGENSRAQGVWSKTFPRARLKPIFLHEQVAMRDPEHIRTELTTLLNEEMDVLERETFGAVTAEELCEYEFRHECIRELYAELIDRESAA
jgi:hypothetical protein